VSGGWRFGVHQSKDKTTATVVQSADATQNGYEQFADLNKSWMS